jgi:hypothetical protein
MSTPDSSSSASAAAARHRLTIEVLLAAAVTLLTLAALIVTVVQTKIAREQQQASVWPYLRFDRSYGSDHGSLTAINKGVGPALIKRVEVSYRGKSYPDHMALLKTELTRTSTFEFGSLSRGDVLQAGERHRLFAMRDPNQVARFRALTDDAQLVIKVVYGDVYGNCWQYANDEVVPLERCP